MFSQPRPLDNPINWSFPIGALWRIRIRVHLLFVLGAILALFDYGKMGWSYVGPGLVVTGMFFLMVLLHEFGHCFGARRVGGEATEILMWPLGGLATVSAPPTVYANLITTLAGPLVNLAFCVVSAAALILLTAGVSSIPLNPLTALAIPAAGFGIASVVYLKLFFAVNYVLLLFNLLPIYPFDGGRILQCILWNRAGYLRATMAASFVGMVGAIALCVFAVLAEEFILAAIAVFGYLTCLQQRHAIRAGAEEDHAFGYDFSGGYSTLDRDEGGKVETRISRSERRRLAKLEERKRREAEEERRRAETIDGILAKVARHGLASLTSQERRLLQEETARKRRG